MLTRFDSMVSRPVRRTARLRCQVVRLRDFRLVADEIRDLSPDGLLVGPADPVFTGEPLLLSFQVPGLSDYVDAEVEVARVVHGRRPGEYRRELGLLFTHVSRTSRLLLDRFSRVLPPAPPRFRPRGFPSTSSALAAPIFG